MAPDSSNEENGFHQVVTWNKVFDGKSCLEFALFCPNDMMFVLWTFHFRLALLCVRTRHEDEKWTRANARLPFIHPFPEEICLFVSSRSWPRGRFAKFAGDGSSWTLLAQAEEQLWWPPTIHIINILLQQLFNCLAKYKIIFHCWWSSQMLCSTLFTLHPERLIGRRDPRYHPCGSSVRTLSH